MKTRISCVLLALLTLLGASALATDGYGIPLPTGTITSIVTVFDGTWSDAGAVGTLVPGDTVVVLQSHGDWVQVNARAQRIVGWIPSYTIRVDQQIPVYAGVVISQSISLRPEPSTRASRLASIPNGTVLDILGEESGWYYVNYHDGRNTLPLSGWVLVDYIVRDPSFVTTTDSTYVYATPQLSAKKVGQLAAGTQLVVIGEYGDFWVVNLRSASGFIYKRDITAGQITGGNG